MTRFAVVLAKKAIFVVLVLSLAVVFYGQPAQALPLVTNGSFEDTTGFVPDGYGAMGLLVGSTTIPSWQVISGGNAAADIIWIPTNLFGLTASEGNYFLDLTGYTNVPPFAGVKQSINTVSGQAYLLGFDLGSSSLYGIQVALTASAGSTSLNFTSANPGGASVWEHFILPFIAAGETTLISFTGSQGNAYIGLDNVTVEVSGVPLPSTVLLLGSGLVGLGLLRRKWSLKK